MKQEQSITFYATSRKQAEAKADAFIKKIGVRTHTQQDLHRTDARRWVLVYTEHERVEDKVLYK